MDSPDNPLYAMIFSASKKKDSFPTLYRICRVIVFIEMVLLLILRDSDWKYIDGLSSKILYTFIPSIIVFILVCSVSEVIGFFLAIRKFLSNGNKYLYKPTWILRTFLVLHYLNTIPIFVCFPSIFGSNSPTLTKVYCTIINFISLFINYCVQKSSFLMCHGIVNKDRKAAEYYRYNFLLTYCSIGIFSICVTVYTMDSNQVGKIICLLICILTGIFLYVQTTSVALSYNCGLNNFMYSLILTLICENIVSLISLSGYPQKGMVLGLLLIFIPISFIFEQEVTRSCYIYNIKTMKELERTERYRNFFKKHSANSFGRLITMYLKYVDNYKVISKAIDYYKPCFAIYEAEFIIAQKKGNVDRMLSAYNNMASISKLDVVERSRLYSYKALLPQFVEEEEEQVVQDCRYYLNKYIFTISKFWENVVLGNIDNLIAVSKDIEINYTTLTTIFQSYGKEGILGECYKRFDKIHSIKKDMNSQIKYNIEFHANNTDKKKKMAHRAFIFLQIILCISFIALCTFVVSKNLVATKNGWSLVTRYAATAEDLQALSFLSNAIKNNFDLSVYEPYVYDDTIFVTKLKNQKEDAEHIIKHLTTSIKRLKAGLLNFEYSYLLDNIFYNSINLTILGGDIENISLISAMIIKQNEIREIIYGLSDQWIFNSWSYYSINIVSLRAIYKIADEVKIILQHLLDQQDLTERVILIFLLSSGLILSVSIPIYCMKVYKNFFSSLFYLRKLELKEFSHSLQKEIENCDVVVENSDENYKKFQYLKERVSTKEFSFSRTKYIAKVTIVSIIIILLTIFMLNVYLSATKNRVSKIIDALSFAKYAYYLPSYMLNIAQKFIDICVMPDDQSKRKTFADIVRHISLTIAEGAEDITDHSNGIVNIFPYMSFKGDNEYQRKSCFMNMASTYIVSALEYLVTNQTSPEHVNWTMQICFDMTTYYIPVLNASLAADLYGSYFDCIKEYFIATITISLFIFILINFSAHYIDSIPNPMDISWSAFSTMPSGVWNDFIEVIDPQMTNEEKNRIGQEIKEIFRGLDVLDKVVTPIILLDENMNVSYVNQNAATVIKKNSKNLNYKGMSIKTVCQTCLVNFPEITELPFDAMYCEGVVDKKKYNIHIVGINEKKSVLAFENVTEEFLIRKAYTNATNKIKILLACKTPYVDFEDLNTDIFQIESKQMQQCIVSTWYLGCFPNPETVKEVARSIREVISVDKSVWISAHSMTTFRIYFTQKHGSIQESEIKAIEMSMIIMDKLKMYQIVPCCYINRTEERRTNVAIEEYLLYESLDESALNFAIPLACCDKYDICISRVVYESLYNNNDVEFSYQTTFGKETIYKLINCTRRNYTPTVLSQLFKMQDNSRNFI